MDKSSITWTRGTDWWLSRTTMSGKERYPKQICVGDLDRPRVYYPINRDALLELADELERPMRDGGYSKGIARRIREALGVRDG